MFASIANYLTHVTSATRKKLHCLEQGREYKPQQKFSDVIQYFLIHKN